jgi:2-C-methyl-D-erythritol 4-phosphate cytidylyltransferase
MAVIIPAAGSGSRFGGELPKQYFPLSGKTVLDWTLAAFLCFEFIELCVVYQADDSHITDYISRYPQVKFLPMGGSSRFESVSNGLNALDLAHDAWVMVHDAARCCVNPADILRLISYAEVNKSGAILAAKAIDTLKQVAHDGTVVSTLEREHIYHAQTPQLFMVKDLLYAFEQCLANKVLIPDEASAIEYVGLPVRVVAATSNNLKITYFEDITIAEAILANRE